MPEDLEKLEQEYVEHLHQLYLSARKNLVSNSNENPPLDNPDMQKVLVVHLITQNQELYEAGFVVWSESKDLTGFVDNLIKKGFFNLSSLDETDENLSSI